MGTNLWFKPENPANTHDICLSFEELLGTDTMSIRDANQEMSVAGYLEERYQSIKDRIAAVSSAAELKQLLAEVAPFSMQTLVPDVSDIKSAKKEILAILEEDLNYLTEARKETATDGIPQIDLEPPATSELGRYNYSSINLEPSMVSAGESGDNFGQLLADVYFRNEKNIRKDAAGTLLPFLDIFIKDYIRDNWGNRCGLNVEAGCQSEIIDRQSGLSSAVSPVLSNAQAALSSLGEDRREASVLALMGMQVKDPAAAEGAENLLLKILVRLTPSEGLKIKRKQRRIFSQPELYSEVYFGLQEFWRAGHSLANQSFWMEDRLKKKLCGLLKSRNLAADYKQYLTSSDWKDSFYILCALLSKKKEQARELVIPAAGYYLAQVNSKSELASALLYVKYIKSELDSNEIVFKESYWNPVVTEIQSLQGRFPQEGKLLLSALEVLFAGSLFLQSYREFSRIREDAPAPLSAEYIVILLKFFDHRNWQEMGGRYTEAGPQLKSELADFVVNDICSWIDKPGDWQKVITARQILANLKINLTENQSASLVDNIRKRSLSGGKLAADNNTLATYFKLLELLFADRSMWAAFKEFSDLWSVSERPDGETPYQFEYVNLALRIFHPRNWVKEGAAYKNLQPQIMEEIKNYGLDRMAYLLCPTPAPREQVNRLKGMLENLGIKLLAKDITFILETIKKSQSIDYKAREIKNGEAACAYFQIMADLLGGTRILSYYDNFSKVNLGRHQYSDFQYVELGLRIIDPKNWNQRTLVPELVQEIKNYYFQTFLSPQLSKEEKVDNLNLLHNGLGIKIQQPEKEELGGSLKDKIVGLVELLDVMEKLVGAATKSQ